MSAALRRLRRLRPASGAVVAAVIYIALYAIYAFSEPSATSVFGLTNLFNNAVVLAIASAGLTLVVLAGEFDLSAIGVIAIANVVMATTSIGTLGWFGALILVLLIGAAIGLLNGWLVASLQLQSLAMTIGTLIACEGVALLILGAPGGQVNQGIVSALTGDVLGVMPVALVIIAGVLLAWLALAHTRLGIALYAVGTDATAARLSGLSAGRTKLLAFVLAGVLYAFAGFMLSCQTGSGDPRTSDTLLLFMYASVAIGGTSLMGGRGGVFGSLVGAGVLAVMQKMLFAVGAASFYTSIFSGIIMLVAIFIGNVSALLARLRQRRRVA
ncbi:MAG: ABC transporter permease [Acetobacteraceae bacterium]